MFCIDCVELILFTVWSEHYPEVLLQGIQLPELGHVTIDAAKVEKT